MTNQLSDRLAAELAVCEAATDGPWEWKRRKIGAPEEIVGVLKTSPLLWPDESDATFITRARTGYPLALRALQAVMELHSQTFDTPWRRAHPGQPGCSECVDQLDGPALWPCPTIQAIWEAYENE